MFQKFERTIQICYSNAIDIKIVLILYFEEVQWGGTISNKIGQSIMIQVKLSLKVLCRKYTNAACMHDLEISCIMHVVAFAYRKISIRVN